MNNDFLNKIPNLKGAVGIINAKKQDEKSVADFAKYLGFDNINEYQKFLDEQDRYKANLKTKFDFDQLSSNENMILKDEISNLIENDFVINSSKFTSRDKTSVADPNGGGPTCSEKRTNCNASSSAVYTLEGLACIGASTLVGSGTFGIGGFAIYAICTSAALVHYNSMLNDCTYSYQDCMGIATIRD